MSLPRNETSPRTGIRSPVSASTSSVCPLPCTPAMPTTSPARTVRSTPSTASSRALVHGGKPGDLSSARAGLGRLLVHLEGDRAADHHLGQLRLGRRLRVALADHLAGAQHVDAVGDLDHLVQLVGDEHQRLAGVAQRPHDAEEFRRLPAG